MPKAGKSNATSRRAFLVGAAAATGGLALAPSLAIRVANAQGKQINFITPFGYLIGFAPVLNAAAGGHFKEQGLEVTVLGGKGGAMAVQQTIAGRAQVGRTSSIDVVKAVGTQEAPLIAVATIMQSSVFSVVSPNSAPIRDPKDMVGKVIGVTSRGGGTENILDMMLAKHGIDPKSVQREAVGNAAGAYGLIAQGRIVAYMPSTGTVTRLREQGEDIHYWNTDQQAPMPGQIYMMHKDQLAKDPDTAVKFLRAVRKSVDEIMSTDARRIVDRLAESFEIIGIKDRAFTGIALKDEMKLVFTEGPENVLRNVPSRWESVTDLMAAVGLTKAVNAADLYTNEYVDKI